MKKPACAVLNGLVVVVETLPGYDGQQVRGGPPVFVRLGANGMDGQPAAAALAAGVAAAGLQHQQGNPSQAGRQPQDQEPQGVRSLASDHPHGLLSNLVLFRLSGGRHWVGVVDWLQ